MSIQLQVHAQDDFSISADEPVTVTVSIVNGQLIAYAYRGTVLTDESEPVGCYDGGNYENTDWSE